MLADINEAALNEAVADLRDDGIDAHGVVCDCRKLDDVVHLADEAFRVFDAVHVVFNNAGIAYAGPDRRDQPRRLALRHRRRSVGSHPRRRGVPAPLDRAGRTTATSCSPRRSPGSFPTSGLGPYCVAKYGVVALAETLSREVRANGIGVSVLCPMIVETDLMANSERVRSADYGPAGEPTAETVQQLASAPQDDSVLQVDDVARLTADAILANRLYIVPHKASRASIQRRFERIDRAFDDQIADGWTH